MLTKLLASVKKESLLLLRDKVGLSILFIMPMVLIFVMTLIQDSAFKSVNERGMPVIFVDNDRDSLGILIEQGLKSNEMVALSDSVDGMPATAASATQAVSDGKFIVGIVVPKGATEAIRKNVTELVSAAMDTEPTPVKAAAIVADSVEIQILIDPIAKKSFLTAVTSSLREFISEVKSRIMFQTFSDQVADIIPDKAKAPKHVFSATQIIHYKEIYASKMDNMVPNAVQHNVPAWTIFAMFFIVIPLSGSIIKEKNEGSVFRLHTMPGSYIMLISGKIVVYVLVCFIQFVLMLLVGLYFLPMLGLPVLVLGNSLPGIAILTIATAFAATGFGVLVGTIASTDHQAAIMGSLSIILLSALGGIWVPTYLMPELMRNISAFSPLNWSLEGFYKLFLRGAGTSAIFSNTAKLMAFGAAAIGAASAVNRVKRSI